MTSVKVDSVTEEPVVAVGSFLMVYQLLQLLNLIYINIKREDFVLHGETETLDYNGESSSSNEYVVAVYDPETKSVELFKTPYMSTKVTAKRNRVYKGPKIKSAGLRNVIQRNALGEAFGTKKAKAAIHNLKRTESILKNYKTLSWILLILLKKTLLLHRLKKKVLIDLLHWQMSMPLMLKTFIQSRISYQKRNGNIFVLVHCSLLKIL